MSSALDEVAALAREQAAEALSDDELVAYIKERIRRVTPIECERCGQTPRFDLSFSLAPDTTTYGVRAVLVAHLLGYAVDPVDKTVTDRGDVGPRWAIVGVRAGEWTVSCPSCSTAADLMRAPRDIGATVAAWRSDDGGALSPN